ncbi:hypothetical protein CROQUDRAFT_55111 [Cronartium quercuum f. sp. fusiforme G11]|uniref:Uncharacterized protein n=1 Tax=Cronartium quercuum f. sp. fusiforme G11 TaxID=708437 RepID=A0A9P6N5S9_9BASI|nr:hypothetical protein CROQUDRAFT_55111 [Cronartium quercuum f. sp. fusiforme G11]
MSSDQTIDQTIEQHVDFYDDYEEEMSADADGPYRQIPFTDEGDDGEDWQDEEGDDEMFPIGYTIQFSPPPPDDDQAGGVGAPRGGLGSQALPVPSVMRSDWNGIPQDGAEYLFTVRFVQARSRPRVVAKANPYALNLSSRSRRSSTPTASSSLPNPAWRVQFGFRFANMRKSLRDQEPSNWILDDAYRQTPPANDESNWKIFIFGKKVTSNGTDQPSITHSGQKRPIPMFLKALDQVTVIAILSHYTGWIEERLNSLISLIEKHTALVENDFEGADSTTSPLEVSLLSAHDGSWLLGLLSILDSVLTSEDIYKLRALARVCKRIAQIADAASKQAESTDDTSHQEAAAGWMVVAAIVDVWGQRDLWDD